MTIDSLTFKASLDWVVDWVEPAEVVPDAVPEVVGARVEETTAEVGEILKLAVPSSTVK
jgi:hypothetical protein